LPFEDRLEPLLELVRDLPLLLEAGLFALLLEDELTLLEVALELLLLDLGLLAELLFEERLCVPTLLEEPRLPPLEALADELLLEGARLVELLREMVPGLEELPRFTELLAGFELRLEV
jgi:hypothetical protein